jgi:hypothetical protein
MEMHVNEELTEFMSEFLDAFKPIYEATMKFQKEQLIIGINIL